MIATIPYTQNIDEMIVHLAKYGHDLIHIPKEPAAASFRLRYFECNICGSNIRLSAAISNRAPKWIVIANDEDVEGAGHYCEKYRVLHG